jgi:hypothetical protein
MTALCTASVLSAPSFPAPAPALPPGSLSRCKDITGPPLPLKGETPMRKFLTALLRSLGTGTA